MKRRLWLFGTLAATAAIAALAFTSPAAAQDTDSDDTTPSATMMWGRPMGGFGMGPYGVPGGNVGPGMRGMRGMQSTGMRFAIGVRLAALDLSADQAARIRQIHQAAEMQAIPNQAQVRVKQLELRQLMQAEQPNVRQIESKVDEIGALQRELKMLHVNARLNVRKQLTAEQLEKLLDPTWRPVGATGFQRPVGPGMRGARRGR